MHADNSKLGAAGHNLFSQEECLRTSSVRNMKLWLKKVKLAVCKESWIIQQDSKELSFIQSKEWMTSLGNQTEEIKLQRQTKLNQWIVGQKTNENEDGISKPRMSSISFQMGGRIHDAK